MLHVLMLGAVAVAMGWPTQSWADDAKPEESALHEAKRRFTRGGELFAKGLYDEAAREFLAAHGLSRLPGLLYNTAQAYRYAGDAKQALDYYDKFLAAAPNSKRAKEARVYAAELRAKLAANTEPVENDRPPDVTTDARTPPQPTPKPESSESRSAPVMGSPPSVAESNLSLEPATGAVDTAPQPGRPLRVAGIATAAVGAVAMGFGLKFGTDARRLSDEASGLSVGDTYDPDLDQRGRSAETNSVVLLGIGGAAAVGGTVLYFLGRKRRPVEQAHVRWTPVAAPGRAGIAMSGAF